MSSKNRGANRTPTVGKRVKGMLLNDSHVHMKRMPVKNSLQHMMEMLVDDS
jgi:hypothetical protein